MHKLAHIINPVRVGETSDLFVAQPITFESMRVARKFAEGAVNVALFTAQYPEDQTILPDGFMATRDLDRSVLDYGSFAVPRKLPLIADILGRLYEASDAEYFIYTNVDIALLPSFYVSVAAIIDAGFDAFIINRRTVPLHYREVSQLPLMYADVGQSHPGYDCFVFRRAAVPDYMLGNICIGAPKIGVTLAANMVCYATRFREFGALHLTFHIGDDGTWRKHGVDDYFQHNKNEGEKVFNMLAPKFNVANLPEVGIPNLANYFAWLKTRKPGNT